MSADLLATATEAALAIDISGTGGPFDAAVQRFVTILQSVPDLGPSDLSADEAGALVAMTESVLTRIDDRLATSDDRAGIQSDLADSVYALRAALEQIYLWRQHYGR